MGQYQSTCSSTHPDDNRGGRARDLDTGGRGRHGSVTGTENGEGRSQLSATGSVCWKTRVVAAVGLAVAAVYSIVCLLYNAPNSPATVRTTGFAHDVLDPYFQQDWQLFGPTPPSSNSLIYMQTRLLVGGKEIETSPVEVESAVDQTPRNFRLNPTKLANSILALDEQMQSYINESDQIRNLPSSLRSTAEHQLNVANKWFFAELQRFLSAYAGALYPGKNIVDLRATFASQPIVPFSDRYQHPQPTEKPTNLATTSWLGYVPGVAE